MSHLIIPYLVQLRERVGEKYLYSSINHVNTPFFSLGISTCFAHTALHLEVVNYFAY